MPTLFIMCGLPGSGKTYTVTSGCINHLFEADTTKAYVSRDQIRQKFLQPGDDYFDKEDNVFKCFVEDIVTNLKCCQNVIADATHISRASRRKLITLIDKKFGQNYNIVFVFIDTPVNQCIEQNAQRAGFARVPEKAITSMASRLEPPSFKEDKRVKNIATFSFLCGGGVEVNLEKRKWHFNA